MKNTIGNNVSVTLFGESHGVAIGAVIDGLPAGIPVDTQSIEKQLLRRRPKDALSTARREQDEFSFLSGVFQGKTAGTPLCLVIGNTDTRSSDYEKASGVARPGHADYSAYLRYDGKNDYRGGGHFSGRITAALVAAGAIALDILKAKQITVGTHISRLGGVSDRPFDNNPIDDIRLLSNRGFAVLDTVAGEQMAAKILSASADGDSIGGVLETAVSGVPGGVGEPWFDSVESMISHAVFSIPAVKGIEFGDGFALADSVGSAANDPLCVENGKVTFTKNSNGGINGGISNGMPILFRTAIKPTPSIAKEQSTVNFIEKRPVTTTIKGRHDPCIVHRAVPVLDSVTALVLCDMLATRFGADYLRG